MQENVYRGDGLNLYAYCANNPVMYFDPYGFAKKATLCVGGKTAAQCETFEEVQNFMRVRTTPTDDKGVWVSGTRGEGLFIPSDPAILNLCIEYGQIGVVYTHGGADFTPFDINNYFGHLGGVGEINLLQRKASKGTWKMFPNWKK